MDRTEKLAALSGLVDTFRKNIDEYKQTGYKEAKVRRDFIDTFFELLDWDIANKSGKSEQYRDVIIEDTIEISGAQKAPDYCFKIGKERKFFVEAKKPSVSVKDEIDPAYQVRRYGHTANLSLSILTDFEEFAVYDTRIKPGKHDKAGVARIFYCTFEDYEKQFDFIYNTFSKEAVEKGSFDKYASDSSTKRGSESVDKGLLSLIEGFRLDLAKNIAKLNKKLDLYQLNAVVTKIIDRIIFLRIAEDRDVERYGTLLKAATGEIDTGLGTINTGSRPRALSHGGKTGSTGPRPRVYKNIREIFIAANEKYNSELFRANETIDGADIDDDVLKDIITALYYPDCPYELSVLPLEILGNIYEQFLGKTIRLTESHLAKVEEKPEVRKAGGVYYTPQYIVEYIVKNTVGEKLNAGNIDTGSVNITDTGSRPRALSDDSKTESTGLQPRVPMTPEDASKMRICDPACGSGSFLIGAYDYLLEWHYKYYMQELNAPLSPQPPFPSEKGKGEHKTPILDKALKEKRIYKYSKGYRLTIEEKKRILLNNIYGVDIDAQAVEVTKLSLVLKILENENAESAGTLLSYSAEKMLPDLSNNIKCGNSLIGTDFYKDKQMDMFDVAEMRKVNAFDWEKEFPSVFGKEKEFHADNADAADNKEDHLRNPRNLRESGFDVVIGNPPYVRVQELEYNCIDYFKTKYKTAWKRIDISILFIELANNILNICGLNGFITSNQFLSTEYGRSIRAFLLKNGNIMKIINFGDLPIFQGALTYVSIFILGKGTSSLFKYVKVNKLTERLDLLPLITFDSSSLSDENWVLEDTSKLALIKKIERCPTKLSQYAKCWAGLFTGKDDVMMFDKNTIKSSVIEKEIFLPVLRAQDCLRYCSVSPSKYVIYPYEDNDGKTEIIGEDKLSSRFPKAYAYLKQHKHELMKRKDSRKEFSENKIWYALTRFGKYSIFKKEKIVSPGEVKHNKFAIDYTGSGFSCARVFAITIFDVKLNINFLLSVLNSKLIEHYLHSIAPLKQGGYYSYSSKFIDAIPLPDLEVINKNDIAKGLSSLADKMLAAQKEYHAAKESDKAILKQKIDAIDAQIDALVYELYGLTQEEIAIVEGKSK